MRKIFILFLIILFTSSIYGYQENINIYYFGTSTCPVCETYTEYLKDLVQENHQLTVYYFELDRKPATSRLLLEFGEAFDQRTTNVPITFISDRSWIGFSNTIGLEINQKIKDCSENTCADSFELLENKEDFKDFLKKEKYTEVFQSSDRENQIILEKNERINIFKRIANFFRNLFTKN